MLPKPIKDILETAPRGQALLGIDVGKKTLGIAVCDKSQSIALPVSTIKRTKFSKDAKLIEGMISTREIGGIVVGLPLSMNGEFGKSAQSAQDFAIELNNYLPCDLWIAMQDERLSTAAARGMLSGKSLKKAKEKGHLDALAAQTILQSALDVLKNVCKV